MRAVKALNTSYHNGGANTTAVHNPFRYRGYYYDSDLNLYYLATRYYDPEVRRFVTMDDPSYLGANGDLVSYNLFAYCSNNPVMYVDPTGELAPVLIAAGIIVLAIGINHLINGIMACTAENEIEEVYTQDQAESAIEEILGNDTVDFRAGDVQITDPSETSRYDRIKISKILQNTTDSNGNQIVPRTTYGLSSEWLGHNLVYNVTKSDQTKYVNLDHSFSDNEPLTKIGSVLLMILGFN